MDPGYYQTAAFRGLHRAVAATPDDLTPQLVLADWLRDHGADDWSVAEAVLTRRYSPWDIDRFFGRGYGSGRGLGSGYGRGSGCGSGYGSGSGSEYGRGRGRGRGSGSGSGYGGGSGYGNEYGHGSAAFEGGQMEIGKAYLVHCGDWHTYVGRVVRQVGPNTYVLAAVSKICDTHNGDCWGGLAAADPALRRACEYRHYTTPTVIPLSIAAFEWVGLTPQEEAAA